MIYRGYKLERDQHGWTITREKRVVAVESNQDRAMNWVDDDIKRIEAEKEKA